jgi:hypothetical protein
VSYWQPSEAEDADICPQYILSPNLTRLEQPLNAAYRFVWQHDRDTAQNLPRLSTPTVTNVGETSRTEIPPRAKRPRTTRARRLGRKWMESQYHNYCLVLTCQNHCLHSLRGVYFGISHAHHEHARDLVRAPTSAACTQSKLISLLSTACRRLKQPTFTPQLSFLGSKRYPTCH